MHPGQRQDVNPRPPRFVLCCRNYATICSDSLRCRCLTEQVYGKCMMFLSALGSLFPPNTARGMAGHDPRARVDGRHPPGVPRPSIRRRPSRLGFGPRLHCVQRSERGHQGAMEHACGRAKGDGARGRKDRHGVFGVVSTAAFDAMKMNRATRRGIVGSVQRNCWQHRGTLLEQAKGFTRRWMRGIGSSNGEHRFRFSTLISAINCYVTAITRAVYKSCKNHLKYKNCLRSVRRATTLIVWRAANQGSKKRRQNHF